MKISFGEILNWIGVGIVVVGIGSCTTAMVVDVSNSQEEMRANEAIRDINGGVIPGEEALILGTDRTVDAMTLLYEGKEYTCFTAGRRMGCVKE